MSLSVKFSAFITLLVFIILSTMTFVLVELRTQQIQQELIEKDKISSVLLAKELSDSFADYYFYQYETYREFVRKKLTDYGDGIHFIMYNTEGEILFDSNQLQNPPGTPPPVTTTTENSTILSAISTAKQQVNVSLYDGENTIHILQPYVDKFDVYRNMFEFNFSTNKIQESVRETIMFFGIFLTVFSIASVAFTVILVNQIIKPVKNLTNATLHFAAGDLNFPIDASSKDEIGTLSKAFKQMASDLKSSHGKLEEQNQTLEKEVQKRTGELQEKITEMERLQKLTVDRELKMIEMKKEIDNLKSIKNV